MSQLRNRTRVIQLARRCVDRFLPLASTFLTPLPHSLSQVPPAMRPTPADGFGTQTSHLQAATENVLKAKWESVRGSPSDFTAEGPVLHKQAHLQYLLRNLVQGLPSRYVSQDASQPWLYFWTLQGFSVLSVAIDPTTKKRWVFLTCTRSVLTFFRAVDTIMALQYPTGGFSGGPGQFPHLLPTYASVCALAIVGQPGEGGGWDNIDRYVSVYPKPLATEAVLIAERRCTTSSCL